RSARFPRHEPRGGAGRAAATATPRFVREDSGMGMAGNVSIQGQIPEGNPWFHGSVLCVQVLGTYASRDTLATWRRYAMIRYARRARDVTMLIGSPFPANGFPELEQSLKRLVSLVRRYCA